MNDNTSLTTLRNQTMTPVEINDNNNNHSPLALLSRAAAAEAACDALGDNINGGSSAQPRKRKGHSLSNHATTMSSFIPPINSNDKKIMMNKSHGAVVGAMKSSSVLLHAIPPAPAVSSDDYDDGSASRLSSRSSPSQPPLFLIPPPPSSMVNINTNTNNNAVSSSSWSSNSLKPSTVLGVFPQFSYPSSSSLSSSLPQQDHLSISPEMEITLTHPQPITTTATQATSTTQQHGGRAAINNGSNNNNNKRDGKYRMKYTYYSMSRKDAHRYIQELTDTSNMQEQKRRMLRLRENSNSNNLSNNHAPVVGTTTPSYYPLVNENPPPIPFHSSPHQKTPAINPATSYLISTTNGGGASGLLW